MQGLLRSGAGCHGSAHLLPHHSASNGQDDGGTRHCERLARGNDCRNGGMDGHKPALRGGERAGQVQAAQAALPQHIFRSCMGTVQWLRWQAHMPHTQQSTQAVTDRLRISQLCKPHHAGDSFLKCARHMPSGTLATTATAPSATSRTARSCRVCHGAAVVGALPCRPQSTRLQRSRSRKQEGAELAWPEWRRRGGDGGRAAAAASAGCTDLPRHVGPTARCA